MLTTQIQIEQDIQKKLKKQISELSFEIREITKRFKSLEDQHNILYNNNTDVSEKLKDLQTLVLDKVRICLLYRKKG